MNSCNIRNFDVWFMLWYASISARYYYSDKMKIPWQITRRLMWLIFEFIKLTLLKCKVCKMWLSECTAKLYIYSASRWKYIGLQYQDTINDYMRRITMNEYSKLIYHSHCTRKPIKPLTFLVTVHFYDCVFLYARLKNGRIMLWQCPSVCPSVRPSKFPDFFSTCFEISIWNLVYAFSRWHDMSSLSFITIGSLWPSLQPKVGQTQFLQSWPYKSR